MKESLKKLKCFLSRGAMFGGVAFTCYTLYENREQLDHPLFYAFVTFVALALAAHFIYKYTGSSEWNFYGEKNGVKLYTMKNPGRVMKLFKGVVRVKSTLNRVVSFMQDSETDLDATGFHSPTEFKRENDQTFWTHWIQSMSFPLKDRDFSVKHHFYQNPTTKQITYKIRNMPDMLPKRDDCVRVPRMNNTWHIIPLPGGEIEIHWIIDMNVGGKVPYLMMNSYFPTLMYSFAAKLQSYFDRELYSDRSYRWIEEYAHS